MTRTLVVVALLWALPSALGAQTPFGRINGFTILSSGQLVGGVTVTATNARGSTQSTVSTPNGTFTFDSLSPGNYRLRATRQGLQPESTTVQVGTGSVDVRIVFSPVVSPPLGRILGLTVLPSGQGEGGLIVTATSETGSSRSTVSTPNGTFTFDSLAPGNYRLEATRQGMQAAVTGITVGAGSVDVRIVVSPAVGPAVARTQDQPALISPRAPSVPLPRDSLKLPVPDSAILDMRQSEGLVAFTPRVGQRARLVLLDTVAVTVEFTRAVVTLEGTEAWGDVVTESGARRGVATIVVRGDQVVANVRRGLRLFQIRPQARGIHLIVEVDRSKMPDRDSDESSGGAR